MALFIQFAYMFTSGGPIFQIDKLYSAQYSKGELCNPMVSFDLYFLILFFSYLLAFILKIVNLHMYSFYEVHIEALRNNKGIQDTARKKYFLFYTMQLHESE